MPNNHIESIALLGNNDEVRWDAYVEQCDNASLYHLSLWRKIITKVFKHQTYYLYALSRQGRIIGILPIVRLKSRLFGDYMVSVPYFNYGGVIADNPLIEEALLDKAAKIAVELGIQHIEFRETEPKNESWSVRTDKVAMILDLPSDPDDLWQALGSKRRAQIKRPLREGVEVQIGRPELLDDFYQVFSRNMRDLGTPVYPKVFSG